MVETVLDKKIQMKDSLGNNQFPVTKRGKL